MFGYTRPRYEQDRFLSKDMAQKSYDHMFLTILIGDNHDTKRKLIFKVDDQPYFDCTEKRIEIDGKIIQLQIWDLGDPTNWSFCLPYLTIFKGMLLTYDITRHESFEYVSFGWRWLIREVGKHDTEIMLIGFNCHQEYRRMVPTETAAKFADELGMKFMEVSTEEDLIDKAIFALASGILRRKREKEILEQQTPPTAGFVSYMRKFLGLESKNKPSKQPPSSSTTPYLSVPKNKVAKEPQKEPLEILARGPIALRAYHKALAEGKTSVKRVPIMVIGQDRSGKTSLTKSLKGQLFNPDEDSTVGIDVDPSHFEVSTETWKAGEKEQEGTTASMFYEHHAAQLIAGALMVDNQTLEEKAMGLIKPEDTLTVKGDVSALIPRFSSGENRESIKEPGRSVQAGSSGEQPKRFSSEPNLRFSPSFSETTKIEATSSGFEPADRMPEEIAALVQTLLHKEKNVEDEEGIYAVVWDFGGQSVYYVTHPLFLTSRAVYLLVYDLSRNPHETATPPYKQGMFKSFQDNFNLKTNLDYLDFWMTSVASLATEGGNRQESTGCKLLPENLPCVFLVCTHADQPHGGADPRALASEIFHVLQNKPYSSHLYERVFVVDNSKSGGESECPEVLLLRQTVRSVAEELPQMKEAIPIRWLQYEKALQVIQEEGYRWISFQRARQVASEKCKIVDDEEFLTVLNFLHDQRILIHFDDSPQLNKLVVLDPQWLIDVFKKVITVKPFDSEEREFRHLWSKLEKTGILAEKLLEHLWGSLLQQEETCESLVAIMEKFSLMCLWPSSAPLCDKQYLVPSLLMSYPPEGVIKLLESRKNPSLFLKLQSYQIPPSLFPRLVLHFLQWCTYEFQSTEDPKLHHNFARFFISPNGDCSIILLCHPSSVEVVLLGERENGDLSADLRSKMTSSVDENPSTDPFIAHVARSVRRQLSLIFECMRKEFFWFNSIRHEVCFLCPVCSQGGTINYCQTHRAQGCMQEECLHFWSESELLSSPEAVICRESVDAVKTRIKLKQFAPWLTHPDEKKTSGGACLLLPAVEAHEGEREDNALALPSAHALPPAVQGTLLSPSRDATEVVIRFQKDLDLDQTSLESPKDETKIMIRCLAREAKFSNRLDVVKHLREVSPAGITGPLLPDNLDVQDVPFQQSRHLSVNLSGGDEWMIVAERLGLSPAEIRFLEKRSRNPFEEALMHCRNHQYLTVGELYDVLVESGYPAYADFL